MDKDYAEEPLADLEKEYIRLGAYVVRVPSNPEERVKYLVDIINAVLEIEENKNS